MAAKTPSSVRVLSSGDMRHIIATFTDIDDNDTWASGIKSALDWDVHTSIDGPQDCTVDNYAAATGTFTFASAANQTGRLSIWCRGY